MESALANRISKIKTQPRQSQQIDLIDSRYQSFKVIVVGEVGVGKTCLIQRLITDNFTQEHNTTVGVEFVNYGLMLNDTDGVKLQVWDTAGQENFRAITRLFYKDSDLVFLLFNIASRKSFQNLANWVEDIDNNTKGGTVKYLVGNFSDMEEQRQVTREAALQFMREKGFDHYLETSAKSGQNVTDLFDTATKHLYLRSKDRKETEETDYFDKTNHKKQSTELKERKKKQTCC